MLIKKGGVFKFFYWTSCEASTWVPSLFSMTSQYMPDWPTRTFQASCPLYWVPVMAPMSLFSIWYASGKPILPFVYDSVCPTSVLVIAAVGGVPYVFVWNMSSPPNMFENGLLEPMFENKSVEGDTCPRSVPSELLPSPPRPLLKPKGLLEPIIEPRPLKGLPKPLMPPKPPMPKGPKGP